MATLIATYRNQELGIESRIAETPKGYSVTLRDTDADEVLPAAYIYPDLERAIAKAEQLANV